MLQRTSCSFALARWDLVIKDPFSTVSFRDSCAKVVISPGEMELEENLSTEKSEERSLHTPAIWGGGGGSHCFYYKPQHIYT